MATMGVKGLTVNYNFLSRVISFDRVPVAFVPRTPCRSCNSYSNPLAITATEDHIIAPSHEQLIIRLLYLSPIFSKAYVKYVGNDKLLDIFCLLPK